METISVGQDFPTESSNSHDMRLWQAVVSRDPRSYSKFVYAVHSTKIYCRPTCPSKKPSTISKVTFYSSSSEAEKSGYEPCKRCKPDEAGEQGKQIRLVQRLCEFIDENYQEKLTLVRLSKESNLSPFHLQRTFKKIAGVTPREYVEAARLGRLRLSLKSGSSIRKSTYGAGYNTSAWLYFRPDEKLGMSPSSYKNGGEGVEIHYALVDSTLGKLLVAATQKGVCFVHLANSNEKLVSNLRLEYPRANLVLVDSEIKERNILSLAVGKLLEYLSRGTDLEKSNIPLDLRATAFQRRVWTELRSIPFGEVRAYSEVAKKVGLPKGTRAVANACASNPVPLIVPCHRVVPKSGGIGQYGLGVERKEILLRNEGVDVRKL